MGSFLRFCEKNYLRDCLIDNIWGFGGICWAHVFNALFKMMLFLFLLSEILFLGGGEPLMPSKGSLMTAKPRLKEDLLQDFFAASASSRLIMWL